MFGGGYSTRRRSIPFATLQIAAHPPGRLRFPAVGASNTFCVRFSCLITCRSVRFIYIYIYMYVYIYIYIYIYIFLCGAYRKLALMLARPGSRGSP